MTRLEQAQAAARRSSERAVTSSRSAVCRNATLYAMPALTAFPGQSIAVTDRQQTLDFFASGWSAYAGVTEAKLRVTVVSQTDHSIWADVIWRYGGADRSEGWQVGVLTPLTL